MGMKLFSLRRLGDPILGIYDGWTFLGHPPIEIDLGDFNLTIRCSYNSPSSELISFGPRGSNLLLRVGCCYREEIVPNSEHKDKIISRLDEIKEKLKELPPREVHFSLGHRVQYRYTIESSGPITLSTGRVTYNHVIITGPVLKERLPLIFNRNKIPYHNSFGGNFLYHGKRSYQDLISIIGADLGNFSIEEAFFSRPRTYQI